MGLILWIIGGALVGWIASMIMGSNSEQGAIGNIVVGMVGALLGGFIANLLGGAGITGFTIYSFIVALLGALAFLWIMKKATGSASV